MIVNLYVETDDEFKLEKTLRDNGFAFYNASHLTVPPVFLTLEDVETLLEGKQ